MKINVTLKNTNRRDMFRMGKLLNTFLKNGEKTSEYLFIRNCFHSLKTSWHKLFSILSRRSAHMIIGQPRISPTDWIINKNYLRTVLKQDFSTVIIAQKHYLVTTTTLNVYLLIQNHLSQTNYMNFVFHFNLLTIQRFLMYLYLKVE